MIELDYQTKPNQRVRLKGDGQDAVYAFATAGSEGWVRDHKKDDMGYPLVKIEWDKDHWAYNGEPDKWAFESHFEPVEEQMDEEKKIPDEFAQMFAEMAKEYMKAHAPEKEDKPKDEYSVSPSEYAKIVGMVEEIASKADAFLLVYVDREESESDGLPILIPSTLNAYRSAESGILLESFISKIAHVSHQSLAMRAIEEHLKEK